MKKNIFLADEVTSALDPVSRESVLSIFSDPAITVISVSHDVEWLKKQNTVYNIHNNQLTRLNPENKQSNGDRDGCN